MNAGHKYMLRVPEELVAQAQVRARAESSDLAKVLRLFLECYRDGRISLSDLLRRGATAPEQPVPQGEAARLS